jgi:hypothetical protein
MPKLKARKVGNEHCEMFHGNKLCVVAKKYGYQAWLHPKSGSNSRLGPLPVPTGRARTMKAARSAAKQFLRKTRAKSGVRSRR